jgi:hypothetical protein
MIILFGSREDGGEQSDRGTKKKRESIHTEQLYQFRAHGEEDGGNELKIIQSEMSFITGTAVLCL